MDFTLHVTEAEVNLIGQALAELPFKISAALISKLQQQVNEQQSKPVEAVLDAQA